jgi:hypothetical protein
VGSKAENQRKAKKKHNLHNKRLTKGKQSKLYVSRKQSRAELWENKKVKKDKLEITHTHREGGHMLDRKKKEVG